MSGLIAKSIDIEKLLDEVDYKDDEEYVPTSFAIEFINFIKLVNGTEGEENTSPVVHYRVLEGIGSKDPYVANMLFRGASKTTVIEYLFLYIGVYGEIPGFGKINLALYIADSIDNGVKNMSENLRFRYENSEFLQTYMQQKMTIDRWVFTNKAGSKFIVKAFGAKSGVRGVKELGVRPQLAVLDDIVSDEAAESKLLMSRIKTIVYNTINHALHPDKRKVIWNGTPFNESDPLYEAISSGAWVSSVYPVCNKFPCAREDFVGAWEDRFNYDYVKMMYDKAVLTGTVNSFNQELMLRIMSAENALLDLDADIIWYDHAKVMDNTDSFNFYITTDYAVSDSQAADFSFGLVWAYTNTGNWLLVDGYAERWSMNNNIDKLFTLSQQYSPESVGIEVNGQQAGFIDWIYNEMANRNIYFPLASENNNQKSGIRTRGDKLMKFNVVLPWFKSKKIWFPKELRDRPWLVELINQLGLITMDGIKSKNDDGIDCVSMLGLLKPWKPSAETIQPESSVWSEDIEDSGDYSPLSRYIC